MPSGLSHSAPPNIILVVIDALRFTNIHCCGSPDRDSANIDALAGNGVAFTDAYCTWNTTDPSLTTILSGKYPLSHGITNHGDMVTEQNLALFNSTRTRILPEMLKEHGYTTVAVDWMKRWFKRGFDSYGYTRDRNFLRKMRRYARYIADHREILRCYSTKRKQGIPSFRDMAGVLSTFWFTRELAELQDARRVTDSALEALDRSGSGRFFLFLHYWDTHSPYPCPREFLPDRRGNANPTEKLVNRYRGAVRYVDHQLGRLVRRLREKDILDQTLIMVTSDHGDSLTEHEIYFDHHGLYDQTTHVPLILHYPERLPRGKRVSGFVQHPDLVPTILALLGSADSSLGGDGKDLLPLIRGEIDEIRPFVYCEESYVQKKRAIRTDRYKYIHAVDGEGYCRYCHTVHQGPEELYDLQEDPGETTNIVSERKEIRRTLRVDLDSFIDNLIARRNGGMQHFTGNVPPVSPGDRKEMRETARRLRGLGYLD